jgi:antitoxin VapB
MALTLKNSQVEELATEVAALAGESKTEAIRKSLLERRDRIQLQRGGERKRDLAKFLETHIWPKVPSHVLGRKLSAAEQNELDRFLGIDLGEA